MSSKSAPQECQVRVPHKNVKSECQISVSNKSVSQKCCAIVSSKSVPADCQIFVSCQGVPQLCPVENVISVAFLPQRTCQHSGSRASFFLVFISGMIWQMIVHNSFHDCCIHGGRIQFHESSRCVKSFGTIVLSSLLSFFPFIIIMVIIIKVFIPRSIIATLSIL